MRDITVKFGDNAGKLWSTLNKKGCLKKKELIELTQLNEEDFHSALGWLVKENKISKEDEDCFKLNSTNLDAEVGACAGKIWKILEIWGDADFTTLKRLSGLNDDQINTALGWLAREDKIYVNEKQKFNLK